MIQNHDKPHEFCVYRADLPSLLDGVAKRYHLDDSELVHRLTRVLRMQAGDRFILFDRHVHVACIFVSATRQQVTVDAQACQQNEISEPHLTLIIGVLKREALEEVVVHATQVGVNVIQPVFTSKVQCPWVGRTERDRLERLAIAAATQCKNFAFPDIRSPISFDNFVEDAVADQGLKLLCDVDGQPILNLLCAQSVAQQNVWMCVGPEGGLTSEECHRLASVGYQACRLTRTTLRSVEAAMLMAGIIRCA